MIIVIEGSIPQFMDYTMVHILRSIAPQYLNSIYEYTPLLQGAQGNNRVSSCHPCPPAPLPPHIGKCPRTTCARCAIVSPLNRLTNARYFIRFHQELKEIWGGEVPPPPAYPCHPILRNVRAPPALGAGSVRLAIACPTHFISCESVKI